MNGEQRLKKDFDMVGYLKKLRIANSLAHLTLTQFQKDLIPFFNTNVVTTENKKRAFSSIKSNTALNEDSQMTKDLSHIVKNSTKSQVDRRMLDELLFEEDVIKLKGKGNRSSNRTSKAQTKLKDILNNDEEFTSSQ